MIELMIKNIFNNSNNIESIVNHINKTDRRNLFIFTLIAANFVITSKIVSKNQEKIRNLENELKEMKSKGE